MKRSILEWVVWTLRFCPLFHSIFQMPRVYRRTRVRRTKYVKRRIGPLSRARSASAIAKSRLGMRGRNPNVNYN